MIWLISNQTLNYTQQYINILFEMSKFEEVLLLEAQLIKSKELEFGKEHVETLRNKEDYAITLDAMGRFEEAENLFS